MVIKRSEDGGRALRCIPSQVAETTYLFYEPATHHGLHGVVFSYLSLGLQGCISPGTKH